MCIRDRDVVPLKVLQAGRFCERYWNGRCIHGYRPRDVQESRIDVEHVAGSEDYRPFEDVFKLADVPRPRIIDQPLHRIGRHALERPSDPLGKFVQQKLHQQRNVFPSLAQRRQMDREDAQAIVEILSLIHI